MKLKSLLHPFRSYRNRKRYRYYKSPAFRKLLLSNPKAALDIFWMIQVQKPMNWDNPQTLNEKNFWLEAYSDTSKWTEFSDKYLVRNHIEELGLGQILTKLYGVWEKAEDIDFDVLPNSFVLKCNHDSGSCIIVKDKMNIDENEIKAKLQQSLDMPYGYDTVEPHYLKIHPVIIAEELLEEINPTVSSTSLIDYKFFCFGGKAECCMICYDRGNRTATFDIYDLKDWVRYKYMSKKYAKQNFKHSIPKPDNLEEMLSIVEKLSDGFPFLRVDLYNIVGRGVVFGELTFTPHGAIQDCFSEEGQHELGKKIKIH